jgi:hypothetical protein
MEAEVMAMRIRLMALVALILVSACGRVPNAGPTGNYRLYEAAARQDAPIVALIDTRSRAAHNQLPLGTPSLDWKHYYTVRSGSLLDIDPATGATSTRVGLPGDYVLPPATNSGIPGGLSQNGRWLVLQRFDRQAQTVPSASHLLVFDTSAMSVGRSIDLDGYFQFDAISNDGVRLFLIQYINGTDYHVRVYSMSGGALDPNFVVDKNEGGDAMNGLKLSGVASHDGQWLFSVYARANHGAFIHALNLDAGFAACLDLPGNGLADGDQSSLDWSLALSPDGNHLYATNPAMGVVTEILVKDFPAVGRTVHVGEPSHVWPAGSVVSADSHTLVIAGSTGVVWLDTSTLTQERHALDSWTVRSLALSPDGTTLYAVNDRGAVAELSMAGGSVTATFDPNIAHPIALMRVEALA